MAPKDVHHVDDGELMLRCRAELHAGVCMCAVDQQRGWAKAEGVAHEERFSSLGLNVRTASLGGTTLSNDLQVLRWNMNWGQQRYVEALTSDEARELPVRIVDGSRLLPGLGPRPLHIMARPSTVPVLSLPW